MFVDETNDEEVACGEAGVSEERTETASAQNSTGISTGGASSQLEVRLSLQR